MEKKIFALILLLCILVPASHLDAEVTWIEVTSRRPFAGGKAFGSTGAYEELKGRLHYSVDPSNPANARIVDLEYAPRNKAGQVEFSGEFVLLKPVDLEKGNHRILFDVNNRGGRVMLWVLNDAKWSKDPDSPLHAGNGFLMKQGYTLLWSEWNWDVKPGGDRMQLQLPVATIGGKPIIQEIAAEIVLSYKTEKSKCEPVSWGDSRGYPVADMNDKKNAKLTVRDEPRGKRTLIPNNRWQFARLEGERVIPDPAYLYMESGFEPGRIYELIYTVKDPRVVGLGLASARDAISFFRYNAKDRHGTLNPLAVTAKTGIKSDTEKVYIFGVSQSGRFITHMIYQGFHVDEANRMVIDGARIHVAGAGKGAFNHRFGQTTHISSHLEGSYMPGDFFPFNFAPQIDPLTGEKGDVLAVAKKMGKIPYIMITNNETEYWTRSASLLHTDVLGKTDAPVHEKVRIYLTCGAAHYAAESRARGVLEHPQNVLNHYPISRALLVALDRWVSKVIAPPPSAYPRIDTGEALTAAQHKKNFPKIPGMRHPGRNYQASRIDYGNTFRTQGIITKIPPAIGKPYVTLVPNFDSDGNSTGGIRLPELQVPLGTYQGWNPRQAKYGAPEYLARFEGSFWPFAVTEAQRKKTNDPRPSIEARYPNKQDYVDKVARAVKDLIKQRYMLEEDGDDYIKEAKAMAWPPETIEFPPFWMPEHMKKRKVAAVGPKILDGYTGQYEMGSGEIVTVTRTGDHLVARAATGQEIQLYPQSKSKFFVKNEDMQVEFITDKGGSVVKLLLLTGGNQIPAKKVK